MSKYFCSLVPMRFREKNIIALSNYRPIAHDVTAPVTMHLEDKLAIYAQYNFNCKQSKFCKTL
jgi:hypothetical protein